MNPIGLRRGWARRRVYMTIREFTAADQPGVTQLQEEFMQEFFPEFYHDPHQYQYNADIHDLDQFYLQLGGKFWVVEEAGEIIGVGGFRLVSPTVAEIKRVRLKACWRGKGLGKAIIRTIEDHCRAHHIKKILVDTDDRLVTAQKMYQKLGYILYRSESGAAGGVSYVNYYFEKEL